MNDGKKVLVRISTVPHSLDLLLKGQMAFMSEHGYEVIMMSSGGPEIPALVKREGCEWIEVPLTREFSVLKDLKAFFYLVRLFRKVKPDIVHSHSPKAGTVGQLAAWFCRVPLRMHTVAGLPLVEYSGMKRRILDAVEKLTYRCAHWVLPNSKVQAQYLLDNKYLNRKKVRIIARGSSNGIDLDYYKTTPELRELAAQKSREFGIPENSPVLSFVGRLTNYKGVSELVQAYEKLKVEFPELHLALVGPYEELNPLEDKIMDLIRSDASIHTTGHVDDVRPYLIMSDIFVFPSYREGFPQSLMQASAMGLPCVASDINGCNEIIHPSENGYLIPAKEVDPIVDSVGKLLRDDALRNDMAENAARMMKSGYDQKMFWNEMLNFYKEHLK